MERIAEVYGWKSIFVPLLDLGGNGERSSILLDHSWARNCVISLAAIRHNLIRLSPSIATNP